MARTKSELYFEEIGDNFDRWMSAYDVRRRVVLIQSLLPARAREMTCLEVGCGTGAVTEAIAPQVGPMTVSDFSERLSRETGERLGTAWSRQDAYWGMRATRLQSSSDGSAGAQLDAGRRGPRSDGLSVVGRSS